jgi:hypothetical protein
MGGTRGQVRYVWLALAALASCGESARTSGDAGEPRTASTADGAVPDARAPRGNGGATGGGGSGRDGATDTDAAPGGEGGASLPATCAEAAHARGWDAARCGESDGGAGDCGGATVAPSADCAACCEWKIAASHWIVPEGGVAARAGGTFGHRVDSGHRVVLGLSEDEVHLMMLSHDDPDMAKTWQLGVGKGSQIYSIVTTYSELMGAQVDNGVWIDRVLQTVAVSGDKNTAAKPYFIHQAGTYVHPPIGVDKPYWSPMLAEEIDETTATLHTLVWPQQAHIYADIAWRSSLLLQQHVRDVGDGVVEITYVYTNFGDDKLDFVDFPWAGFAKTPVPVYAKSTSDGGWVWATPTLWTDNHYDNTMGNGWYAMLRSQATDAMGLGVVYGKSVSRSKASETARWGPQTGEDLTVLEALPGATIAGGESYFMRYYLVFGRLSADIHPRGNELAAGHVDWGTLSYSPGETSPLDPCRDASKHGLAACAFWALDRPVAGALPLLLLKDKTSGALVISTSPYAIHAKPYLGTSTEYLAFLGWGIAAPDADAEPPLPDLVRLGSVVPDRTLYPDPDGGTDVWVVARP